MSTAPAVSIDPPSFWNDPYPVLAEMRRSAPICFVPELGATLLTRRDDIHTCEKNVAVFSSEQPGGLMNVLMGNNMMRKDGEDHRKERFVYYPAISPNAVKNRWAQVFEDLADAILDSVDAGPSQIDLVLAYATALSGEALKALTGLTNITHQEMDAWSQAMIDGVSNYIGDTEPAARCHEATALIDAAIDERISSFDADTDPSLLGVMLRSGMALDQVRANIKLTISGGQNEPRDAIAGATWALLSHRDQLAMVLAGEVSWSAVFDEYCRWIAPIGMSPRRIATTHKFGGVTFEPDDRVFLMFSSANRDETHFTEPDRFDITRDTAANLTFGAGPHFCAGAAASRSLIGEIALPRLFERFPDLALAADDGDSVFGGWAFRGPLNVRVELRRDHATQ